MSDEHTSRQLSHFFSSLNYGDVENKDRLIIALDFGTTFSGVAYAFSTKSDRVYPIIEWPGADDRKVPKTPTILKYDNGSTKGFLWGYEVDPTAQDKIESIKLLLDPDQPKPLYVPPANTQAELDKLGKPASRVATDYIKAIYQHAMTKIEGAYPKSYIDLLDKQFVLSVPAIWSDKAKDLTQRAAMDAGIRPITLIKEPEAAALYTFHFLKQQGLEVGDAIVICDAGGGTVDLISYEITSLAPLELKELVPSSGGLAGSLMLNRRFEQWISDTVGEEAFIKLKKTNGFRLAMQQFDLNIKPSFRSKQDKDRFVNFPMADLKDNPRRGVVKNSITLKGTALYDIFDPLVRDIIKLVSEQVDKVQNKRLKDRHPKADSIKAIFLVGGFGSSIYLKEVLVAEHPEIQVIQPNDAWSAIVQGAVLSQLPQEAAVISNVAEKHYGVSCNDHYNAIRDKGEHTWVDKWEGNQKCKVMNWFIYKGDDLSREHKISLPFYRKFSGHSPSGEVLQITDDLYESKATTAPVHPKNVSVNCTLHTDLNKVPKNLFVKRTRKSDGADYCELHYNLLMQIQSGPMKFSLQIDGIEYSNVNAEY